MKTVQVLFPSRRKRQGNIVMVVLAVLIIISFIISMNTGYIRL